MGEAGLYAEVLVDLPARQVDRVFHYLVPAPLKDQVTMGSRVQVPFGRQKLTGYVTGFTVSPRLEQVDQLKEISAVLDPGPVFAERQLTLARWLAEHYLCPTVSALQAIIGPRLAGAPRRVQGLWPAETADPAAFAGAPAQEKAWRAALARPGLTRRELAAAAGVSPGAVDALVAKQLLSVREYAKSRSPFPGENGAGAAPPPPALAPQQEEAVREIRAALEAGGPKTFLLYGVTGSGKTEVYCRSVARALGLGRQAVVLVPEIALTPQMVATFRSRFGPRVAVLHSRLSDGERYDEWMRVWRGEADVVLGARSALFAPLREPGLIIIDEEHEPSYKQEESPRYHARTVALHLARERGAVVVLGSATPALESFYAAGRGEYRLLRMDERIESRPLPQVRVVDMRAELRRGNRGFFSRQLLLAVRDALARREQVILFLNRRGFSTIVVCRECGLVVKCPHCDVSLTYHTGGRLLCHYCNHTAPAPARCPDCRSKQIGYFGAGTQKIEQEVRRLFPQAGVLRLDSDTAARKGSHREILTAFRQGEADILIGTQMIAKGLDIPSVTLVGVVNADVSLHMPDFRAS
ncbi:MAG: primosomal protein N', partial [Bacillota bacterium]